MKKGVIPNLIENLLKIDPNKRLDINRIIKDVPRIDEYAQELLPQAIYEDEMSHDHLHGENPFTEYMQ